MITSYVTCSAFHVSPLPTHVLLLLTFVVTAVLYITLAPEKHNIENQFSVKLFPSTSLCTLTRHFIRYTLLVQGTRTVFILSLLCHRILTSAHNSPFFPISSSQWDQMHYTNNALLCTILHLVKTAEIQREYQNLVVLLHATPRTHLTRAVCDIQTHYQSDMTHLLDYYY